MITAEQFAEVVRTRLQPAMERRGLRATPAEPYTARFQSNSALLQVSYDVYRTRQLHAWLAPADDENEGISLDALAPPFPPGVVHDESELANDVGRIADFLATQHPGLLDGDPVAFAEARSRRTEHAYDYTTAILNAPTLRKADDAWIRHDFALVAQLLKPIQGELDPLHLRRLQLAIARTSQPDWP